MEHSDTSTKGLHFLINALGIISAIATFAYLLELHLNGAITFKHRFIIFGIHAWAHIFIIAILSVWLFPGALKWIFKSKLTLKPMIIRLLLIATYALYTFYLFGGVF